MRVREEISRGVGVSEELSSGVSAKHARLWIIARATKNDYKQLCAEGTYGGADLAARRVLAVP